MLAKKLLISRIRVEAFVSAWIHSIFFWYIYIYNNYQYTYTRNEILSKYHDQKHVVCHSHIYIYICARCPHPPLKQRYSFGLLLWCLGLWDVLGLGFTLCLWLRLRLRHPVFKCWCRPTGSRDSTIGELHVGLELIGHHRTSITPQ